MWDAVLFFLVLSLSSPFPLPFLSLSSPFSFPFLYSSCSFSFSFSFPFSFPFSFSSYSFPFSFPFVFLFLFLSLLLCFPFPSFIFFSFSLSSLMWILWWRCEASAWKHDKRKKNDNVWKKNIWKGSGFLQDPICQIIYIYIYIWKPPFSFMLLKPKHNFLMVCWLKSPYILILCRSDHLFFCWSFPLVGTE